MGQSASLTVNSGGYANIRGGLEFGTGGGSVILSDSQLYHTVQELTLGGGSITGSGEIFVGSAGLNLGTAGVEGSLAGTSATERLVVYGDVSGTGSMTHVTVFGDVSVGNSPGTLTANDVMLSGASTLTMELGGLAAGTEHDQIVVDGALALDGTLDVVWYDGFEAAMGDTFTLFDNVATTPTGTFGTMNLAGFTDPDLAWDTSALYSAGTITAVPEPATISFLMVGALALIKRRRK